MRLLFTLALTGLTLVGCQGPKPSNDPAARFEPKGSKKSKPTPHQPAPASAAQPKTPPRVTPLDEIAGKVASINGPLRFVVLDFSLSKLPAMNQHMAVYRNGQKVGEVKVTGPARDANIAADISVGEAQVGDEVRGY